MEDQNEEPLPAEAGAGDLIIEYQDDDPENFKREQWEAILRNNTLLYGLVVNPKTGEVSKARRPAFQVKESAFENAAFDHYIFDDSTISVTEVHNQFQRSLVQHCLNMKEVEVALGVALPDLANVGTSFGVGHEASSSTSYSTTESSSKLQASYNFPRMGMYLDENFIELTPHCSESISEIRYAKDHEQRGLALRFLETYGSLFSKEVQVGGQMNCVCSAREVVGETVEDKLDALKATAAAAFGGAGASARNSVKASRQKGFGNYHKQAQNRQRLLWEVRGGDTTLVSDPAQWVATVKNFTKWRVIKRFRPVAVYEMAIPIFCKDMSIWGENDIRQLQSVFEEARAELVRPLIEDSKPDLAMCGNEHQLADPEFAFNKKHKRSSLFGKFGR